MFFQFCLTDPNNEDDVLEETCIDGKEVESRTNTRLGLFPVQVLPVAPWFQRYLKLISCIKTMHAGLQLF